MMVVLISCTVEIILRNAYISKRRLTHVKCMLCQLDLHKDGGNSLCEPSNEQKGRKTVAGASWLFLTPAFWKLKG